MAPCANMQVDVVSAALAALLELVLLSAHGAPSAGPWLAMRWAVLLAHLSFMLAAQTA